MPNSSSNSKNHCIAPVASMPTTTGPLQRAVELPYCISVMLEKPSRLTRRFRCPSWLYFVAPHGDRSLQFSSRPPSSRAFWLDTEKSTRCEADVVMTSATPHFTHEPLPLGRRVSSASFRPLAKALRLE